jgi:hypothetical protein
LQSVGGHASAYCGRVEKLQRDREKATKARRSARDSASPVFIFPILTRVLRAESRSHDHAPWRPAQSPRDASPCPVPVSGAGRSTLRRSHGFSCCGYDGGTREALAQPRVLLSRASAFRSGAAGHHYGIPGKSRVRFPPYRPGVVGCCLADGATSSGAKGQETEMQAGSLARCGGLQSTVPAT